jgi:hypothetical protein
VLGHCLTRLRLCAADAPILIYVERVEHRCDRRLGLGRRALGVRQVLRLREKRRRQEHSRYREHELRFHGVILLAIVAHTNLHGYR